MPTYEYSDAIISRRESEKEMELTNSFNSRVAELLEEGEEVNDPYVTSNGFLAWFNNLGQKVCIHSKI